jgi:hypothetical protein
MSRGQAPAGVLEVRSVRGVALPLSFGFQIGGVLFPGWDFPK